MAMVALVMAAATALMSGAKGRSVVSLEEMARTAAWAF